MSQTENCDTEVLKDDLAKVLSRHGFGFQYSVVRQIEQCAPGGYQRWNLRGVEVPVEVQGTPTHLDILLSHFSSPMYLVAECKRANPKLSNWVFLKAPYATTYATTNYILMEAIDFDANGLLSAGVHQVPWSTVYQLPVELRTNEKGEDKGSMGRGAVEEAATQVLRHLNGFVGLASRAHEYWKMPAKRVFILPVVFTTARLFSCNADLSTADLRTGNLDLALSSIKEESYLFYQYNQSPSLKHGFKSAHATGQLGEFIVSEYSRTIAIVSPGGIEEFLLRADHML